MMDPQGLALWRQISKTLENEIDDGVLSPGDRLPASAELASRFGVNRHTILKAVSHLQNQGFLRTERGGGIYVERMIPYRMGLRDRLEENLLDLNRVPSREILSVVELQAPIPIARALDLLPGDVITAVRVLSAADGVPISINQNYFPKTRLPGVTDAFRAAAADPESSSATRDILHSLGVGDFRRKSIRIRTRLPRQDEVRYLRMPATENVFEVEVSNIDQNGVPVVFGSSIFCGSRVEFVLDLEDNNK